jgi:hypothetical protein
MTFAGRHSTPYKGYRYLDQSSQRRPLTSESSLTFRGDERHFVAQGLRRQRSIIVGSNRLCRRSSRALNSPAALASCSSNGMYVYWTGQESFTSSGVVHWTRALENSIPQFESHDRGNECVAFSESTRQSLCTELDLGDIADDWADILGVYKSTTALTD